MAVLKSTISTRSAEFQANQSAMQEAMSLVREAAEQARDGVATRPVSGIYLRGKSCHVNVSRVCLIPVRLFSK